MRIKMFNLLTLLGVLFLCFRCDEITDAAVYRYELTMNSGGITRTYVVKLPSTYYSNETAYPIFMALHGTGGSAYQMEMSYGLNEKADAEGFIVVYPEGVRSVGVLGLRTWNAGKCCDYAMDNNIDDVGFIRDLIQRITDTYRTDPHRLYITGMSNGGMMAYRLGCELSEKIAAIASVSCTMIMDKPCQPERAVPILHLHSKLDTKIPYLGGVGIGGYYFPPVDSILTSWAITNACTLPHDVVDNGQYIKTTWLNCTGQTSIESYVTYDGGHAWPGGKQVGYWADRPSMLINANDLIWDFFQRFQLP